MKKTAIFAAGLMLIGLTLPISAKPGPDHLKLVARGMIESLNSEDTGLRERFLKDHYVNADSASALERWQGHLQRFSQELGKVEIHNIDVSDPAQLHILIRTMNSRTLSQWIDLSVYMDQDNPEQFFSMGQSPGQDPNVVLPDRPLTTIEIAQYVSGLIDDMVARDVFSGAVLLAKDGKPFFTGAYGKADLRWGIDNKLDTKFNLGSMNKMFTGVAICQLASQEKLSFDDPISKYLPDYPNEDAATRVTVHHLLTHTSGMGSYWDAMDKMDWTALRSIKDFADLASGDPLTFEPGERFQYSNCGPLVLGLIIEAVSGLDYHEYIREFVTGPAGMINTDCYHADDVIPNLAQGYFWNDETNAYRSNIFAHSARGSAAGGGFSTVEDLQRFSEALYDGTLLPAHMVDIYTTGKVDMGPNDRYAYLISDSRWDGHRTVGHNGGAPGINADLKIFTDLGFTVTAMSNYDGAANAITTYATRLITHKRSIPN
ncbi:MAG: beta-lactamase family protein [candidate division Zixibacteria bacterium]|nr:beta-lactamase family protein [candidate division Zixibacteria bacterium]